MDEKGIGWIGAILIFVVGSIILTLIINPQLREDIAEWFGGLTSGGALSPGEVREHPHKYLGENITVEGYYSGAGLCMPNYPAEDLEDIADAIYLDLESA